MTRGFERLGRAIAEAQDEEVRRLGEASSARVRAKLLAEPLARARRRRAPFRWAVLGALASSALAAGVWRLHDSATGSLTYRVDAEGPDVAETGRWLAAPAGRPLSVHFSDQSEIDLAPASELRVTKVESDGATIEFESGRAQLAIRHRNQTHWTVFAGPFVTHVVGTRFDLTWDPATRAFRIVMFEGVVEVNGPVIGSRRVAAGETVSVSVSEQRAHIEQSQVAVAPPALPAPAEEASTARPHAPPAVDAPRSAHAAAPPPAKHAIVDPRREGDVTRAETAAIAEPAPPSPPSYEELAREGRYAAAVAAASAAGWDRTLTADPASSLLLLGDAARLSGQYDRAALVYQGIRGRFPSSREAADSAFALGRLAQDQRQRPGEATRWFDAYLREEPRGAFAREAEGRMMETEVASDQTREARDTAAEYLKKYPDGPHAQLARHLVGSGP